MSPLTREAKNIWIGYKGWLRKLRFIFTHVCAGVRMSECHACTGAHVGQKKVSDHLEVELQVSSATGHAANLWATSPAYKIMHISFFLTIYYACVCTCMDLSVAHACNRPRDFRVPRNWSYWWLWATCCGCWELNTCPLHEQRVSKLMRYLSSQGSSLTSIFCFWFFDFYFVLLS